MDENIQILLNSTKNINAVNVDTYNKIELSNKRALLHEYEIKNVLSATEVFNIEREANAIYRIYGKIEYLSLLNGLKNSYSQLQDFFLPQASGNSKNLLNSFDFYLVKAGTGYTHITGITAVSTIRYIRYFEVIATPAEFELYPVGFANNVYGEQAYAFNFNIDFDVSDYFDNFGFPATELFLYAQYKPAISPIESIYATTFSSATGAASKLPFTPPALNIGDYVKTSLGVKIGDLIEYSDSQFYQAQLLEQTFYIHTPYLSGITHQRLVWKYNPFIPFTLRYFSEEVYGANISGTSYEQTSSIPSYATEYSAGTGNYVWRTILEQGYFDPLTNIGVDYPFVNKKRYLFSNIVFDIMPDLNDVETLNAFEEIKFGTPLQINLEPAVDDLNNIGKPCQ
jgi:hypothetical protein